jgi:hypothetical protein
MLPSALIEMNAATSAPSSPPSEFTIENTIGHLGLGLEKSSYGLVELITKPVDCLIAFNV